MNITFYRDGISITKDLELEFFQSIEALLIKDLEIVDGMGERTVINYSGKFVKRAEIIDAKWKVGEKELEKTFSGTSCYIIQDVVEELESLG